LGYQVGNRIFALLKVYQAKVEIRLCLIGKSRIADSKGILEDMPGGYDKNSCRFYITKSEEAPYALELIRQAYEGMRK
jgi:predicted transport protein